MAKIDLRPLHRSAEIFKDALESDLSGSSTVPELEEEIQEVLLQPDAVELDQLTAADRDELDWIAMGALLYIESALGGSAKRIKPLDACVTGITENIIGKVDWMNLLRKAREEGFLTAFQRHTKSENELDTLAEELLSIRKRLAEQNE